MARLRRRLFGPAGGPRGRGPLLTVVAVSHGGGADLGPTVQSLQAVDRELGPGRLQIVEVADPSGVGPVLASAAGTYLAFVDPDVRALPAGYDAMLRSLEATGSACAVAEERWAGPGSEPPRWCRPTPPGGLTDLSLTNKLFRLDWWRAAGITLGDWSQAPTVAADVLLRDLTTDLVHEPSVELRHSDAQRPVTEQRRFDAVVAATRTEAWRAAARLVEARRPAAYDEWRLAVLSSVLPPRYVDAVGGGQPYVDALRPFVLDLLTGLSAEHLARMPVEARLAGFTVAHGSLDDVGLVLGFLHDNAQGLPFEGGLVLAPPGLAVELPQQFRSLERVDRRLRSRVRPALPDARELVVDAFVEYEPSEPPEVEIRLRSGESSTCTVAGRPDPGTNLWAERAFEDRADASHAVTLAVPARDVEQVRVVLGGQADAHDVRTQQAVDTEVRLEDVGLAGDGLVEIRGSFSRTAPAHVFLAGERGEVAGPCSIDGGRFVAHVPLTLEQFGEQTGLPAGAYSVRVSAAGGSDLESSWASALLVGGTELIGSRLALRPTARGGAGLRVEAPLSAVDRSAHGQRLLRDRYRRSAGPSRPATVMLEAFGGRSTGDNPGAIGTALREVDPELDLVYVVDDPSVPVPPGARAVARRTPEWFELLAEAGALVTNAALPPYFQKKPGQLHVQTWHGTPLKRIGEDRGPGDFGVWWHRRTVAAQAARWDVMVSSGSYTSEIYRSAFGFRGSVLEVGYPRNDILLSSRAVEVRDQVRRRLGLAADARVVLYAPTWREYLGARDAKPLYLDSEALVQQVPGTVVLVRGHYNAFRQRDRYQRNQRVLDVTRYPDIADLFLAADVLVTDYSSVIFDFALTDKPMVMLVPDLEQYRDVERGFYFDFEERAPGPLVRTTDEVARVLEEADTFGPVRERFRREFCPHEDGTAGVRVASWIRENLGR